MFDVCRVLQVRRIGELVEVPQESGPGSVSLQKRHGFTGQEGTAITAMESAQ